MVQLQFSILIQAQPEKVWDTLWDDASYRNWTAIFSEGSHAVSDWKQGSTILFLSPEGEGMYSRIHTLESNRKMFFEHLGMAKDGQLQPETEETKAWKGAMEKYTLQEKGTATELIVSLDTLESHQEYFDDTFPKALARVKELAES